MDKSQAIYRFNLLENQLRQIEQQIVLLDQQITRQQEIEKNIEELKKIEKNAETFLPFSEGILVKAKITDNENLLVNVGGNALLEKNINGVKEIIKKQIGKITSARNELSKEIEKLVQEMFEIEQEFKE